MRGAFYVGAISFFTFIACSCLTGTGSRTTRISTIKSNPSDSVTIVRFPTWYKGTGIIFPASYTKWGIKRDTDRFTPTVSDISKAEDLLHQQFMSANLLFANNFASKKIINREFRQLEHANRQYVGFYNRQGEKVVYIRLLDFSHPRKAEKLFAGWKQEIPPATGELYARLIRQFDANLHKNRLSVAGSFEY